MQLRVLALSLMLLIVFSCAPGKDAEVSGVVADLGSTPRIDGVFEAGEWDDANAVRLDSTKTLRLKHDGEYLHMALEGDGATLYIVDGAKLSLLHASFSLGSAEYAGRDDSWRLVREYEWELYGVQGRGEDEVQDSIGAYLERNGWVGSLMPMGNRYESELSVAFSLLGIPQGVGPGETAKTHIMFLSSCKNVPPAERTGSPADRRFRWPPNGAPCDSLDRGYTPETVHIDRSAWAEITMRMED